MLTVSESVEQRVDATEQRSDGLPVGVPFAKGRSGNPNGRPRGAKRIVASTLIGPLSEQFASQLLSLAKDAEDETVRLEACRLGLAYAVGPPPSEPNTEPPPDPAPAADRLLEARKVLEGTTEAANASTSSAA